MGTGMNTNYFFNIFLAFNILKYCDTYLGLLIYISVMHQNAIPKAYDTEITSAT